MKKSELLKLEAKNASTLNLFERKDGASNKTPDIHFVASNTDNDDLDIVGHPVIVNSVICAVCIQGQASIQINFKSYLLTEGSFVILSPGMMFLCKEEAFSPDFIANYISFSPDLVKEISLEQMVYDIKNNPYLLLDDIEYKNTLAIFNQLKSRYLNSTHPYRKDVLKHSLLIAIYDFSVIFDKYTVAPRESNPNLYNDKFFELLFRNYRRQRKTEFYAEKLNITPKYLSKIIKDETGNSVQDWIFQLILFETKSLLRSTNMNVTEIAEHFNYPDSTSFGKFFKKHEGLTPIEYRRT